MHDFSRYPIVAACSAMIVIAVGAFALDYFLPSASPSPTRRVKECQDDRMAHVAAYRELAVHKGMEASQLSMAHEIEVLLADSECGAITAAAIRQVLHDLNRRVP